MEQLQGNRYSTEEMASAVYGQNAFYAHVAGMEKTMWGESHVIKIEFIIAEENRGIMGENWSFNEGKFLRLADEKVKDAFIGSKVKHNGLWLAPNASREDAWKNKRYYEQMSAIMTCPQEDGKFIPFLPELSDILGHPCIIKFDIIPDKNDKAKSWNNLVFIDKWTDGVPRMPTLDPALGNLLNDTPPPGDGPPF